MFENKNQPATAQTNLSQNKDLKLEDFPIHTMQKDLADLAAPPSPRENSRQETSVPSPSSTPFSNLNDTQKSSPFLTHLQKDTLPHPSFQPVPNEINETLYEEQPAPHGKTLNILLVILLLILFIGGGYYFLFIQHYGIYASRIMEHLPGFITNSKQNVPDFLSSDKPNYLNVDMNRLDKSELQSTLLDYAQKISELTISTPIEFIITDTNNNPLTLREFASKTELGLGEAIMSHLQPEFSIFLFIDQGLKRSGIVLHSDSPEALREAMIKEEASLANALSPLFLASETGSGQGGFGSSSYNGTVIRYQNIISPEELSIDYAIVNRNLVIGTTKMTLRLMLDYLQTH